MRRRVRRAVARKQFPLAGTLLFALIVWALLFR